jgi:hypothetical protein
VWRIENLQAATTSQGYSPFVPINYSPTICLNPPILMIKVTSWPIAVGQEKRRDGGPD